MIFDTDLDCFGGNPKIRECVKTVKEIMLENGLVDIWRIRNMDQQRFTCRNGSPKRQRRLDFWLISDHIQDDVKK